MIYIVYNAVFIEPHFPTRWKILILMNTNKNTYITLMEVNKLGVG